METSALLPFLAACALCACREAATTTHDSALSAFLDDPSLTLPAHLSQLKLDASTGLQYEPTYPLWSDGGEKRRAVYVPSGTRIDTNAEHYGFPLGTLLAKTFSFRTPESPDVAVPVETRLLRLTSDGWHFEAYGWDASGADASLLELRRPKTRDVLDDLGNVVPHSVPSRLECRQCHESSDSVVLGFNRLQLEPDALQQLGHGPRTTALLGYFVGNCVHCHNGSASASSSLDLGLEAALQSTINQPTTSSATAAGVRVLPGKPEQSVLFLGLRAQGELEVKSMPPLGVALRDLHGIELVGDWITALASEEDP